MVDATYTKVRKPAKPAGNAAVVAKAPAAAPADLLTAQEITPAVAVEVTPIITKPATPTQTPKEPKMSTPAFDFTAFTNVFADLQEKAKAAFEKNQAAFGEYNEFAKGNLEALVEAGKVLAAGVQGLSSEFVAESKTAFEALTTDAKELAAAKSPTDFFKLQSDLAKKQFDSAVAASSKHSETVLKLAGEVAAPIKGRVEVAVEKVKTAA